MKVVMVEPDKPAYITEIDGGYQSMRNAVGGIIEPMYFLDDAVMVGNEEAKLLGMDGNRRFGDSIVAGTFFICGEKLLTVKRISVRCRTSCAKNMLNNLQSPNISNRRRLKTICGAVCFFGKEELYEKYCYNINCAGKTVRADHVYETEKHLRRGGTGEIRGATLSEERTPERAGFH